MKYHLKKYLCSLLALVLVLGCITIGAAAAQLPAESAVATGSYRHPGSGKIEDSGGESSEALGQSMVTSVVSPEALMETAPDGTLYLSLRFNLMSNISSTKLSVQKSGETSWSPVEYEVTATGEDSKDLRIPFPAKDAIVRAECFVDAMGRAVVFYVTVDGFTPGNSGNFAQLDSEHLPSKSSGSTSKSDSNVIGDSVVGLVTGGSGNTPSSGNSANAVGNTVGGTSEKGNAPVQEVIITWRVWVMFFLLVFCAQMLACLCFWGIKTLISSRSNSAARKPLPPLPDESKDDMDFLEENWDDNWEEIKDAAR